MIPQNIEKVHIEKAIAETEKNEIQKAENSSKYNLIYTSKCNHPFDGKGHQCGIGKINVLEGNKLNTQVGEHILDWFVVKADS